MIENQNRRIVNFMFLNPFPVKLNEFSNRLRKYFDGRLEKYISDTETRINAYIENIKNDELEELDENDPNTYPISYSDSSYLTFDISSVGRIALAASDDPFFKLPPTHKKYFPELVIYNSKGKIIEVIDESKAGCETITKGSFDKECRDTSLKVNDDRKASISLMLQKDVQMVLLVIRTKDLFDVKDVKSSQFDRAQFRLLDDETNQTLDEARIKDMKLTVVSPQVNEDGEEEPPAPPEPEPEEDEEENKARKPQNIIVMGRVALNEGKWIYEQYHYVFKDGKYPTFFEDVGKIEFEARDYFKEKESIIKEEERALKESREAAAQAAAAKAAGKKTKKDKKKKDEDAKDSKDVKETKEIRDDNDESKDTREDNKPDIQFMPGFKEALQGVYSTVFGPLTFKFKDDEWDVERAKSAIMKKMKDELGNKVAD